MAIICFDYDGTITESEAYMGPATFGKVRMKPKVIKLIKLAKRQGHKIIIHTSRLSSECMEMTVKQLNDAGVPFDGIHFDKPFYDYVIDDRMVSISELEEWLKYEQEKK